MLRDNGEYVFFRQNFSKELNYDAFMIGQNFCDFTSQALVSKEGEDVSKSLMQKVLEVGKYWPSY